MIFYFYYLFTHYFINNIFTGMSNLLRAVLNEACVADVVQPQLVDGLNRRLSFVCNVGYNPIQSGAGWILPAATLNVNNFSNIEANATKFGDVF